MNGHWHHEGVRSYYCHDAGCRLPTRIEPKSSSGPNAEPTEAVDRHDPEDRWGNAMVIAFVLFAIAAIGFWVMSTP